MLSRGSARARSGQIPRRGFLAAGALTLPPRRLRAQPSATTVTVSREQAIGLVRPERQGQFAQYLNSCFSGGPRAGPASSIPNVEGYRKAGVWARRSFRCCARRAAASPPPATGAKAWGRARRDRAR